MFIATKLINIYLDYKLKPLQESVLVLDRLSSDIIMEINSHSKAIQLYVDIKSEDSKHKLGKYSLRNPIIKEGKKTSVFYGYGYFWDPKFYQYGEFIYENLNHELIIESNNQIYSVHKTNYYDRPWFKDVEKAKAKVIYAPLKSWIGESQNLSTVAYPIFKKGSKDIIAVGVFDVSMDIVYKEFSKLISNKDVSDEISIYYASIPYNQESDQKIKYFNLSKTKESITDIETGILDNVLNNNQNGTWRLLNWKLYYKHTFLDNNIIFIEKYNIKYVVLYLVLWIIFTFFIIRLILIKANEFIEKQISLLTNPISSMSKISSKFSKKDLEITFDSFKKTNIVEVFELAHSLENLYIDVKESLKKEYAFKKSKLEMNLAASLQNKILAKKYSKIINHDLLTLGIEILFTSAEELNGDIYNVVVLENDVYILIGDASGKNITAAFFSMLLLCRFEFLCKNRESPDLILNEINSYLCNIDANNMFISAVCVQVSLDTKTIKFSNAGHEMPLFIKHDGECIEFKGYAPDIVLGVIPNYKFNLYELPKDDVVEHIVLFTDGVSEVKNQISGELLGRAGIFRCVSEALKTFNSGNLSVISNSIMHECNQLESDLSSQSDDRTIIYMHLKGK